MRFGHFTDGVYKCWYERVGSTLYLVQEDTRTGEKYEMIVIEGLIKETDIKIKGEVFKIERSDKRKL